MCRDFECFEVNILARNIKHLKTYGLNFFLKFSSFLFTIRCYPHTNSPIIFTFQIRIFALPSNAKISCNIKHPNFYSDAKDGAYQIKTVTTSNNIRVYCQMTSLAGCAGGGWTMVMKVNGSKVSMAKNFQDE